jgi:hypothetical protein
VSREEKVFGSCVNNLIAHTLICYICMTKYVNDCLTVNDHVLIANQGWLIWLLYTVYSFQLCPHSLVKMFCNVQNSFEPL